MFLALTESLNEGPSRTAQPEGPLMESVEWYQAQKNFRGWKGGKDLASSGSKESAKPELTEAQRGGDVNNHQLGCEFLGAGRRLITSSLRRPLGVSGIARENFVDYLEEVA